MGRSNAHFHRNRFVRSVPDNLEVCELEPIDPTNLLARALPLERGELERFSLELGLERVDVVQVDVRVSDLKDELVGDRVGHVCDHVR